MQSDSPADVDSASRASVSPMMVRALSLTSSLLETTQDVLLPSTLTAAMSVVTAVTAAASSSRSDADTASGRATVSSTDTTAAVSAASSLLRIITTLASHVLPAAPTSRRALEAVARWHRGRGAAAANDDGGGHVEWTVGAVEAVGSMVTSTLAVGTRPVTVSAAQSRLTAAQLTVRTRACGCVAYTVTAVPVSFLLMTSLRYTHRML